MNKKELLSLIGYLIVQSRYWHLEYAREFIIESEYKKIEGYRDKFDKDLYEKGCKIINEIEEESKVREVMIIFEGNKIVFTSDVFSTNQLRQIVEDLKDGKDVDTQTSINKLFIDKDKIIGYHAKYESEYKEYYHK